VVHANHVHWRAWGHGTEAMENSQPGPALSGGGRQHLPRPSLGRARLPPAVQESVPHTHRVRPARVPDGVRVARSGLTRQVRLSPRSGRADLPMSARGDSGDGDQPLLDRRDALHYGVVIKDALVPNGADNDDVLQVTATRTGQCGTEFDEHPPTLVL
jgi:hypothetical protein